MGVTWYYYLIDVYIYMLCINLMKRINFIEWIKNKLKVYNENKTLTPE